MNCGWRLNRNKGEGVVIVLVIELLLVQHEPI